MTNTELLAKIKAEIERLKKNNEISEDKDYAQYELDVACGYDMACDDILSFLSTLESEKSLGLEEEIKRYYDDWDGNCRYAQTARHFAKWGAEHLKK